MNDYYQTIASTLADGQISADEAVQIGQKFAADDKLDLDDVKLLVELYCAADHRSPEFDKLFFSTLEGVFLADGQIQPSEEYYLLKLIYSDREITEPEREFLRRLRKQLPERTESFERLFDTAMDSPSKNWSVGGRPA